MHLESAPSFCHWGLCQHPDPQSRTHHNFAFVLLDPECPDSLGHLPALCQCCAASHDSAHDPGHGASSNTALPKPLCAASIICSYKALCHVQWHQEPAHLRAMNPSNGNPLDSSHAIRELNRLAAGSWHCQSLPSDIANVSLVFLHSELANQLPHFMVKFFNMVLFSFT